MNPPPYLNFIAGATGRLTKRALMSYLSEPFHIGEDRSRRHSHANYLTAIQIAGAFNRLGYAVDVVDWTDRAFIPTRRYEAFLGMTANFPRLTPHLDPSMPKIYFATRPHPEFEQQAIATRLDALWRRRGVRLEPPAYLAAVLEDPSLTTADAVIALGNDAIVNTFRPYHARVLATNNLALPLGRPALKAKDFEAARKHFLYLSSGLLVRKGLDVTLEAFTSHRDVHLWVCAPLLSEMDFVREYRRELFHTPNIHPIGWVDMHSDRFLRLTERCAFLVFPSCAEGQAGSVLSGMARGLIPLVTPQSGVNPDDAGVVLDDVSPDAIGRRVVEVSRWPAARCLDHARAALGQAETRYSIDAFAARFERILRDVLGPAK